MTINRLLSTGLSVVLLSACTFGVPIGDRSAGGTSDLSTGSPSIIPETTKSKLGNPSSYVVFGKRYYVLDSAEGFVQRGIASWYGSKFHGKNTSSGEIYNMHAMTAAHKTLPIPVYVRVENLENGKTIIVKVNDRGPFIDGRIIDLSYTAAKKLGIDGPGTAEVEISTLTSGRIKSRPVVRTIALADDVTRDAPLYIQLGSFGSESNAQNLLLDLQTTNESTAAVSQLETEEGLFYRVRIGPLYDLDEANSVVRRLRDKGYTQTRIVVQD